MSGARLASRRTHPNPGVWHGSLVPGSGWALLPGAVGIHAHRPFACPLRPGPDQSRRRSGHSGTVFPRVGPSLLCPGLLTLIATTPLARSLGVASRLGLLWRFPSLARARGPP